MRTLCFQTEFLILRSLPNYLSVAVNRAHHADCQRHIAYILLTILPVLVQLLKEEMNMFFTSLKQWSKTTKDGYKSQR